MKLHHLWALCMVAVATGCGGSSNPAEDLGNTIGDNTLPQDGQTGGDTAITGGTPTATGGVIVATGGANTGTGGGVSTGGSTDAGTGGSTDAGISGADAQVDPAPTTGPFPPVSDFTMPGPYTSTTMQNVGPNNNYTVYLPTELAPGGAKNPIVGWMSGGSTVNSVYALLPHLATHGFVVVASNTVPAIGAEVALGQEIIAGIDWAIAENGRSGSELFEKLDTTKLASSGYSMGSLATFTIVDDPRLTTTVHISGGSMDPAAVGNLHAPAAFICGTPGPSTCSILDTACDIAAANCDTDFAAATTPVFYANFGSGHLGILTPPYTDYISTMATAWLRYQLMGDTTLKPMFVGNDCSFCKDSNWTVQQKNLN